MSDAICTETHPKIPKGISGSYHLPAPRERLSEKEIMYIPNSSDGHLAVPLSLYADDCASFLLSIQLIHHSDSSPRATRHTLSKHTHQHALKTHTLSDAHTHTHTHTHTHVHPHIYAKRPFYLKETLTCRHLW